MIRFSLCSILLLASLRCYGAPPEDAVKFGGSYYKIFDAPGLTWNGAAKRAQGIGGSLASLESDAEAKFVSSIAPKSRSYYWIGLFIRSGAPTSELLPADQDTWMSGRPNFHRIHGSPSAPVAAAVMDTAELPHISWIDSELHQRIEGYIVEWEELSDGTHRVAEVPDIPNPGQKGNGPGSPNPTNSEYSLQGVPMDRVLYSGIVQAPASRIQSRKASLRALLVMDLGDSNTAGFTSRLNLMAIPTKLEGEPSSLQFNQEVGKQMRGALNEVIRFVRFEHGGWPYGHQIEISFENKYTAKDGPSAAVACALLIDSIITGYPLNPDLAVTGDLNSDGTIQPIGGVASKLKAASEDGCTLAVIPFQNRKQVIDEVIVNGFELPTSIPVFVAAHFEEAKKVAHVEFISDLEEGMMSEFSMIQDLYKKDPKAFRSHLSHPAVRSKLENILKRNPRFFSAEVMLDASKGNLPKTLSIGGSLTQIDQATGELILSARETAANGSASFNSTGLYRAVTMLQKLRTLIDPQCVPYNDAIVDFGKVLRKYIEEPPAPGNRTEVAIREVKDAIKQIDLSRERLIRNPEVMSELVD
ncbi:MAG: S16 family serine protease [Verrucomicrobiota bacterium]